MYGLLWIAAGKAALVDAGLCHRFCIYEFTLPQ